MESTKMENDYLNKIREGDYVIMKKLHDKTFGRLLQIDLNVPFLIGKNKFDISNLVGKEYGSIYTVNNKNKCLDYVGRFEKLFNFKSNTEELKEDTNDKDNRFFTDDNRSQKLTYNEINKIKEDGLTTKEIIETLVENSSTFNQKTIYSQEKYLKKKQEKYSNFIRIYKPNPILLCDMWFNQGSYKTCGLRIDSLSHLLNLCNVRSGCKYMVVDTVNGLVTASIIERLIGDCSIFNQSNIDIGKCVQVYLEAGPLSTWRHAINALNYKEEHLDQCLLNVQIHKTVPILKSSTTNEIKLLKNENVSINQLEEQLDDDELNDEQLNDDEEIDDESTNQQKDGKLNQKRKLIDDNEFKQIKRIKFEERQLRKKKRLAEEQIALELMSKKNFDGLIVIARNHNISEIVDHLINFLSPSSQFVVFSNYIETLTECYSKIRHKTCNLKLNDIWMRNYQVLPMRTRPDMEMFGKSGYILHGINLNNE